jgi:succinyl-CoA synthetase beta subunit
MKIHEYQAKQILKSYGVVVLDSVVATDPEAVGSAFTTLAGSVAVVKAQIHAGGRGKGGGVKLVKSADEAKAAARAMQAKPLVTHQTGPQGQPVRTLLVERGCSIAKELYVGVALDRARYAPVLMASSEGGVEIEEVAARTPEKIIKETIDPALGLQGFQARRLAKKIGIPSPLLSKAQGFFTALTRAYLEKDCTLAEINPLVITSEGGLLALDAKMTFDDNALYRQADLEVLRDFDEEDPSETEAKRYDLSFIKLDGSIGCMVNGAGLAMATMDTIKHFGGQPANFLDVGGSATEERVTAAFKIITADPKVRGIFVNIFGGIMKCDTIASGVIAAVKQVGLKVPLVVRLEGTNVELGRKMLAESGLALTAASDMADGARRVVALAEGKGA